MANTKNDTDTTPTPPNYRILVRDASAPGQPAGGGRPAIAPGCREATGREIYIWFECLPMLMDGETVTAEEKAEISEWYDLHIQTQDQQSEDQQTQAQGTDHANE